MAAINLTPQDLKNLQSFLGRVPLKGSEVNVFNRITIALSPRPGPVVRKFNLDNLPKKEREAIEKNLKNGKVTRKVAPKAISKVTPKKA